MQVTTTPSSSASSLPALSTSATPRVSAVTPLSTASSLSTQLGSLETRINILKETLNALQTQALAIPPTPSNGEDDPSQPPSTTALSQRLRAAQASLLSLESALDQLRLNYPLVATALSNIVPAAAGSLTPTPSAPDGADGAALAVRAVRAAQEIVACRAHLRRISTGAASATPLDSQLRAATALLTPQPRHTHGAVPSALRLAAPSPLAVAIPTPSAVSKAELPTHTPSTRAHPYMSDVSDVSDAPLSPSSSAPSPALSQLPRNVLHTPASSTAAGAELAATLRRTRRAVGEGIGAAEGAADTLGESTDALRHAGGEARAAQGALQHSRALAGKHERRAWLEQRAIRAAFLLFLAAAAFVVLRRTAWFATPAVMMYRAVSAVTQAAPALSTAAAGPTVMHDDSALAFAALRARELGGVVDAGDVGDQGRAAWAGGGGGGNDGRIGLGEVDVGGVGVGADGSVAWEDERAGESREKQPRQPTTEQRGPPAAPAREPVAPGAEVQTDVGEATGVGVGGVEQAVNAGAAAEGPLRVPVPAPEEGHRGTMSAGADAGGYPAHTEQPPAAMSSMSAEGQGYGQQGQAPPALASGAGEHARHYAHAHVPPGIAAHSHAYAQGHMSADARVDAQGADVRAAHARQQHLLWLQQQQAERQRAFLAQQQQQQQQPDASVGRHAHHAHHANRYSQGQPTHAHVGYQQHRAQLLQQQQLRQQQLQRQQQLMYQLHQQRLLQARQAQQAHQARQHAYRYRTEL